MVPQPILGKATIKTNTEQALSLLQDMLSKIKNFGEKKEKFFKSMLMALT